MAALGMVGDAEAEADSESEPKKPRRHYSWRAPRWLPIPLGIGAAIWAASIWWMVANLGAPEHPAVDAGETVDEVAVLRAKVDNLTQQTAALGQEREALAKRVAALEARPTTVAAAAPTVQPTPAASAPAATTQPAIVPMNLTATAETYSVPRFGYLRSDGAGGTVSFPISSAPTGTSPRFFTNGADKYNCTSFGSQAEAQEALSANAPGDPNKLDMNANGVACEDISYPANTPKDLTPIANR